MLCILVHVAIVCITVPIVHCHSITLLLLSLQSEQFSNIVMARPVVCMEGWED